MTKITTFRDLLVWQKSHQLTLFCYKITSNFPKNEMFGLISQTRRSAASVSAKIVEGFRRVSINDSIRFYIIADASLEELKYHLLLAHDLEYLQSNIYKKALLLSEETGKLLTRWIQSQKKRKLNS